ncbi:Magnesium-protoporphyrin O-methyltransferase [Rubripirellula lacrimiformis]|uniref:Magnesium-protoporphyrin O-methyltransferase n=1 Tax=Rubripirellula lacrimiformis TaxID=1930273 RepID=A0A517N847_9BACT|nr:class I SAM-dependent methyltransferase [Rubripirellula lacrimiformis]QDT03314.1 Magnesium-protoporphyrin O-methyltransferase [Rubripirellula lacrimiformis]
MSKSQTFWDKASSNYDRTEERFEYIHSKSRENAKKYLNADAVVLDYGCGTGTTTCEFASLVKEIHALDTSSKMIELAKQKASVNASGNAHFVQTDIFDDRYERESFDVILAFNMLHTVENVREVMQRIHDLLKPEGKLISVTPCLKEKMSFWVNLQIQLVRLLTRTGVIPVAIRRLVSSELDDLMAKANFQTIEAEKIFKGASSYFVVANKR